MDNSKKYPMPSSGAEKYKKAGTKSSDLKQEAAREFGADQVTMPSGIKNKARKPDK